MAVGKAKVTINDLQANVGISRSKFRKLTIRL